MCSGSEPKTTTALMPAALKVHLINLKYTLREKQRK